MLQANADQWVLGYLGRALSLELTAVQQYATQAMLVKSWGLTEDASKLHQESIEEMQHVERIIARMLVLGVAPNASMLRPAGLGQNLRELLLQDAALEKDLINLYSQATQYCARNGDYENRKFFEELLEEERGHDVALARWLETLATPNTSAHGRATF